MEPEQLIKLRNDLKLTRTEFGKLFHFAQPYTRIYELETGKMPISSQIACIAGLLANSLDQTRISNKLKDCSLQSNKIANHVIEP